MKLVKEALQQKSVELVVRGPGSSQVNDNKDNSDRIKMGSGPSAANEQGNSSLGSTDTSNTASNSGSYGGGGGGGGGGGESKNRGTNAVEEYQST